MSSIRGKRIAVLYYHPIDSSAIKTNLRRTMFLFSYYDLTSILRWARFDNLFFNPLFYLLLSRNDNRLGLAKIFLSLSIVMISSTLDFLVFLGVQLSRKISTSFLLFSRTCFTSGVSCLIILFGYWENTIFLEYLANNDVTLIYIRFRLW